jgi:hypothetical protein
MVSKLAPLLYPMLSNDVALRLSQKQQKLRRKKVEKSVDVISTAFISTFGVIKNDACPIAKQLKYPSIRILVNHRRGAFHARKSL